jgi:hypothetical protein
MNKLQLFFTSCKVSIIEYFLSISLIIFDTIIIIEKNLISFKIVIDYLIPNVIIILVIALGLFISSKYWNIFYNNREKLKLKNVNIQIFACKLHKITSKLVLCIAIYSLSEEVNISKNIIVLIYSVIFLSAIPVLLYKENV